MHKFRHNADDVCLQNDYDQRSDDDGFNELRAEYEPDDDSELRNHHECLQYDDAELSVNDDEFRSDEQQYDGQLQNDDAELRINDEFMCNDDEKQQQYVVADFSN